MAITDPHIIAAGGNYAPLNNQSLAERFASLAATKVEAEAMRFTAGFTLNKLGDLLASVVDTQQGGVSTKPLGWVFLFPPYSATAPDSVLIKDIKINQINLVADGPNLAIDVKLVGEGLVRPKIYANRMTGISTSTGPLDYNQAFDLLQPTMVDDTLLHLARLDGYEIYGELAFMSRSDLDLMKTYLGQSGKGYNDLFFSGASVNFLSMQHPLMVIDEKTLVGTHTQLPVPEGSKGFSLKVEPLVSNEGGVAKSAASGGSGGVGGAVQFLPEATLMAPCPNYWYYIQAVATAARAEEQGLDEIAVSKLRSALVSKKFNGMDTVLLELPHDVRLPPVHKDFFDRLRDFWYWLTGRAGRKNKG
ncbi:hypothetical protein QWY85_10375 [Neolewinella lacunae]|uniref:Uncharacterized protein n=1 Tax=Neolewinella lacunae TaxID=1517758 RepID=A0A923PJZ0_9BACT|nr:hypothetical protein [Neolewinella lacunae]MBC6995477.1 hypothetical protein [Neolewinella lacunae]MDN3635065.1 hypothetical protein [Neolewinella lacunae]